jgi:Domain of unknown function (DUF6265)
MKKESKLLFACISLMINCAWTPKPTSKITKAKWLVGTWENKTSRGSIFESWSKTNNMELAGKSYTIKQNDTIFFENIRLIEDKEGLFYIPVVKKQNDGLPVKFVATNISKEKLVFENAQHDFPQIISYTKINKDSLVAEISGIKNGKERKQIFPMKRLN